MISYIKGKLESKNIDNVIIEVGGIGYKIFMSSSAINRLGEIGADVKIRGPRRCVRRGPFPARGGERAGGTGKPPKKGGCFLLRKTNKNS